ncbi:hypothetical protein ACI4A4_28250, partial [Klebsiella pneumoniae]|uniref:hypothetical protein n=1 Tax=Klebsiella pneumoniae TaxID=573 RepID=UPI003854B950
MVHSDGTDVTGHQTVVFYDPVCQKPYDSLSIRQAAAGGTEASVVRVADALGAAVMQHNRTETA